MGLQLQFVKLHPKRNSDAVIELHSLEHIIALYYVSLHKLFVLCWNDSASPACKVDINLQRCGHSSSILICSFQNSSTAMLKPTPTVPNSDACKHYQILSEPTRAFSYKGYTSKCDSHLYGWYRFMGQAGNRMQSSCSYGPRSRCGSHYQGWLLESHPSVYEGEVSRTVCFTRQYSCYCRYRKTIKVKNCGSFYVYWLDGVPACNLRYCGAKGMSLNIQYASMSTD